MSSDEMFRVFNMGVGMIAIVAQESLAEILPRLGKGRNKAFVMGSVVKGGSGVVYDLGARAVGEEQQ